MDDREQRAAALRAELDQLKSALLSTTDERTRHAIHRLINARICESLVLMKQRPPSDWAMRTASQTSLHARHPGEQ
jgi:hypothetical protein